MQLRYQARLAQGEQDCLPGCSRWDEAEKGRADEAQESDQEINYAKPANHSAGQRDAGWSEANVGHLSARQRLDDIFREVNVDQSEEMAFAKSKAGNAK